MSTVVQAAMQFDIDTLEPSLVRVAEMIPGGFGEREIAQVVGSAERLQKHQDDELMFPIEDDDGPARLRVAIRKNDSEGWDVRFFAPRNLAQRIEAVIKRLD